MGGDAELITQAQVSWKAFVLSAIFTRLKPLRFIQTGSDQDIAKTSGRCTKVAGAYAHPWIRGRLPQEIGDLSLIIECNGAITPALITFSPSSARVIDGYGSPI